MEKRIKGVMFKELSSTGFRAWSDGCSFSTVVKAVTQGFKFKITHESGNCFSRTKLFVILQTREWKQIASEFDINGCNIEYYEDESVKMREMEALYDNVLNYIVDVFL